MFKAQKVYYCEYGHYIEKDGKKYCECEITTDEEEAMELDKGYRLASITEVNEFIGLGYEPIKIVETSDGVFGWVELEYETTLGDIECFMGYIFLQMNSDWEIMNFADCLERCIAEAK